MKRSGFAVVETALGSTMNHATLLKPIAPGLWTMTFTLTLLGADMHRNVTILRLVSGKLIIHSTAPFTAEDVAKINGLGEPGWLVEALLRHDTFAKEGSAAFPESAYLAPAGFDENAGVSTLPLFPAPPEWTEEITVLPVDGAPSYGEIVMLHRPSRTIIVGDLLINFPNEEGFWTKSLLTLGAVGGDYQPGVTRPLKLAIKDEAAFAASLEKILSWDFERIIVGHGVPVESGGKDQLRRAYQEVGVLPE